ncbi:response regulator [Bacillus altitudinis]|uniref:Response regulator n=2 Tax=Bacillus TaxID=1386 RepID=A0ABV1SA03_BACAB|nr:MULTISPECIES: response regulator [Bacillus]AHL70576.1 transcriptional regulator [Bacillus pumilus]MBR3207030.1 response regulator [Bacillus sp. (in: firmicutes)]MDH8712063.1 CitB family two-component system response regulator CitT [Micromonospora sp. 1209]MXP82007.1 response regulator [Bacillus sp. AN2]OQP21652.1 response regulator [Bacillus stratosphericus]QAR53344.1 response regulator [Bacillus aerophilus]
MIKVLIAEDDFRIAAIHESYIQKVQGFQVAGKAKSAKDLWEALQKEQVDLILLDVYMPDELGTNLLPLLRERHPEVDVIIITAATETMLLRDALHYGVVHYLIKPVTAQKFTQVLTEYKEKRELINSKEEVNQTMIDLFFGQIQEESQQKDERDLPTGINSLTLDKVKTFMAAEMNGITAEELGEKMGASRTTARRYVEYLVTTGECRAELAYGIIGRPERKYYPAKKQTES